MITIQSVLINLKNSNETRFPLEKDGFIGFLNVGEQMIIEAFILLPEFLNIFAFEVDGKKNVILKKDWGPLSNPPLKERRYQTKIQIKKSLEGTPHTEYPSNNLRIIRLDDNGQTWIWEIALVSQNGSFFLTVQKTYEFQCCRQGKILIAPMFDSRWPQLVSFLRQLPIIDVNELPDFSEYTPPAAQKKKNLEPKTGRVLWFNFAQGIGAIETPEGNARVHWSQIEPRPRLAFLETGELVSYKKLIEPVQTKTRNTSFPRDALGVRVL